MVLGMVVGGACHAALSPAAAKDAAGVFTQLTDVFLRLIKMIIAPLVISTLIGGIAHMGEAAAVGRVGLKTMIWFLAASLASLLIGMSVASLLHLGSGLHLSSGPAAPSGVQSSLTLKDFLGHIFPSSVIDAMGRNEILQIVVFAVFAGMALGALGERVHALVALIDQVSQMMLKITGYVMLFAPVAVFGAIAATVSTEGLGILATYAAFVGWYYACLALFWCLILAAGFLAVGPRIFSLLRAVRGPLLVAFSTSASEAAYPQTLERLEAFGVSKRVASFVLPLGYSFNLDGAMIYCTFAVLFIAQAYGIQLSFGQKASMILVLMVTSKGIAGVPRASLVVVAAALTYFRIPEAGLALVLSVDHFLDMGRSATNVLGNCVAASVVARWEGELGPASESL